ncbi:hypothetical protein M9H77_03460 [Catharanthus roseus]|uniref:Uncharacterized protein n=1 Tax=Catharanthus roseus TaxID=4058 RepID=A0ACC0CBG7_CATRO|nr:hypothetical protein M9H77_03460 [Catharanthus roseus]
MWVVPAQKIYNVIAKIKRNRIQGRNMGYMVFYRKCDDSNTLSDIVVSHSTSIQMMRTYNMPLLEVVGMTPTGKNFTIATAFMWNEHATTYRWVLQQIKHLYFSSAMSTESSYYRQGKQFNACDRRGV